MPKIMPTIYLSPRNTRNSCYEWIIDYFDKIIIRNRIENIITDIAEKDIIIIYRSEYIAILLDLKYLISFIYSIGKLQFSHQIMDFNLWLSKGKMV